MIKSISPIIVLLLMSAGPAMAGGDWKMGPFGPYWDDNSWPEFTPMYWMEEFMNRLDDDDDEIQDWMLRNQFPGQYSTAGIPGGYPLSGWNTPGAISPNVWQANPWSNPLSNPYAMPYRDAPPNNWVDRGYQVPPHSPYRERRTLPELTPEEFSRMPGKLQREYKREYKRLYSKPSWGPDYRERRPLPNLTPQEFSRMPRELQREYKRAFDRRYAEYRARRARECDDRLRRAYPVQRRSNPSACLFK